MPGNACRMRSCQLLVRRRADYLSIQDHVRLANVQAQSYPENSHHLSLRYMAGFLLVVVKRNHSNSLSRMADFHSLRNQTL